MRLLKNATEITMEFKNQIKKVNQSRTHLIHNSYGCKDYYLYFQRKYDSTLTQAQFTQILRAIMCDLIDKYLITRVILNFPNRMGSIRVDDIKQKVVKENDTYKLKAPIDWVKTLDLWNNDADAYKHKLKIYSKHQQVACLKYLKRPRSYHNQKYYYIKWARSLKKYIYQKLILNDNFNYNG